ncbi:hypothetical protein WM31_09610 [Burkholderia ubonensis]|nr:hypothetical protein WM31_09610 [Burkholderia ubonensis]
MQYPQNPELFIGPARSIQLRHERHPFRIKLLHQFRKISTDQLLNARQQNRRRMTRLVNLEIPDYFIDSEIHIDATRYRRTISALNFLRFMRYDARIFLGAFINHPAQHLDNIIQK